MTYPLDETVFPAGAVFAMPETMSIRDEYAAAALTGLLATFPRDAAGEEVVLELFHRVAKRSFQLADIMLDERAAK